MFHKWGFLLSEMWGLLILAALVGLLAGWIIWGRRKAAAVDTSAADSLRAQLAACNSKGSDLAARLSAAEQAQASAETRAKEAETRAIAAEARARAADDAAKASATVGAAAAAKSPAPLAAMAMPAMKAAEPSAAKVEAKPAATKAAAKPAATKPAAAKPAAAKPAAAKSAAAKPAAAKPAAAPAAAAPAAKSQPKGLTAARGGKPDDLKLISGVGPKLEALCHKLGFFHFDQVAAWTAAEIAWVDENLEGFKGRVTRDEWVAQAKDLAAGKPSRLKNQN